MHDSSKGSAEQLRVVGRKQKQRNHPGWIPKPVSSSTSLKKGTTRHQQTVYNKINKFPTTPLPKKIEVIPMVNNMKNSEEFEAVLVVGSTGTGKSSTVSKCTGQEVHIGDGHKPVTRNCEAFFSDSKLAWIDTEGWDDPERDDTEIFQSMLQFLNRHDLTRLKAVIWAVHPGTIRQDATLNKQAKLIDMFAEKEIWNNVIIICKQAMNPEAEAKGALEAGYAFNRLSKLQVIGFRYLQDPTFTPSQKAVFASSVDMQRKMNVLSDDEVRSQVIEKIQHIPSSIQIIFKHFRCRACGEEGDHRLLPLFCHMEKAAVHRGSYKKKHTQGTERYHPSKSHIFEHTGPLYTPIYASCVMCGKKPKKYRCCHRDQEEEGCQEEWACCKKPLKNEGCQWRYSCCQIDVESAAAQGCEVVFDCCGKDLQSDGCHQVCKKCGAEWGTKTANCFQKPHQLERVEADV